MTTINRRAISLAGITILALHLSCGINPLGAAIVLDFENLPDSQPLGDFYASQGVHFNNDIVLTAGFSLNEIDYPPHSGSQVVGDNNGPLTLRFDNPVNDVSAYYTTSSELTFTAYDAQNIVVGTYFSPFVSNLGNTTLLQMPIAFDGLYSLTIAGADPNSFIMDDLQFTPVPEPGTFVAGALTLLCFITLMSRELRSNKPKPTSTNTNSLALCCGSESRKETTKFS